VTGPPDPPIVAWFDCSSGVSGDMVLGALLDAGARLEVVQAAVDAVAPEPVLLRTEQVSRAGLRATKVHVECEDSTTRRTWRDIQTLLEQAAGLDETVRVRALAVFAALATAEGKVHGVPADEVHFHEVGALDAIADIVGACAALVALGIVSFSAGPVALGRGEVRAAHGTLPVPVPAVVELLRGAPVRGGDVDGELATPTGAALLGTLCDGWSPTPDLAVLTGQGVGAGSRDVPGRPNVLRVLVGQGIVSTDVVPATPAALLLETNVDDLDPRLWPAVLTQLLHAGASDAWLTPILMKKGRPAHTLSVLVTADRAVGVRRIVFTETTALGMREQHVAKTALARETYTVDVSGHSVRIKVGLLDGAVVNAQPEYEDVVAAAAASGRPAKAVLAEAVAAAHAAGLVRAPRP
jgi:uncharacterized protein (TIGR00299 family) protein